MIKNIIKKGVLLTTSIALVGTTFTTSVNASTTPTINFDNLAIETMQISDGLKRLKTMKSIMTKFDKEPINKVKYMRATILLKSSSEKGEVNISSMTPTKQIDYILNHKNSIKNKIIKEPKNEVSVGAWYNNEISKKNIIDGKGSYVYNKQYIVVENNIYYNYQLNKYFFNGDIYDTYKEVIRIIDGKKTVTHKVRKAVKPAKTIVLGHKKSAYERMIELIAEDRKQQEGYAYTKGVTSNYKINIAKYNKMSDYVNNVITSRSDSESVKIRKIFDWVVKSATYTKDVSKHYAVAKSSDRPSYEYTFAEIMKNGKTDLACETYSDLFYALLVQAGVKDVKYIVTPSHGLNKIGDKYYDTTQNRFGFYFRGYDSAEVLDKSMLIIK